MTHHHDRPTDDALDKVRSVMVTVLTRLAAAAARLAAAAANEGALGSSINTVVSSVHVLAAAESLTGQQGSLLGSGKLLSLFDPSSSRSDEPDNVPNVPASDFNSFTHSFFHLLHQETMHGLWLQNPCCGRGSLQETRRQVSARCSPVCNAQADPMPFLLPFLFLPFSQFCIVPVLALTQPPFSLPHHCYLAVNKLLALVRTTPSS